MSFVWHSNSGNDRRSQPDEGSGRERRLQPRFVVNLPVQIAAGQHSGFGNQTGRMVDVSEGGLSFICPRLLVVGTTVTIALENCRLQCEVRHCRPREFARRTEYLSGVAIQEVIEGLDVWRRLVEQYCAAS